MSQGNVIIQGEYGLCLDVGEGEEAIVETVTTYTNHLCVSVCVWVWLEIQRTGLRMGRGEGQRGRGEGTEWVKGKGRRGRVQKG